tara:strand:- start:203 stop:487 length:285 start_codon:yes stop_codon:yes gene_type:complete
MKAIDSILLLIKSEPEEFVKSESSFLAISSKKHDLEISFCGNGSTLFLYWITSIVSVHVSGNEIRELSWLDKAKIEITVSNWFKSATIDMMRAK